MVVSTDATPAIDVGLQAGPLDVREAMERFARIRPAGCGGEATFVGRIRPERDAELGDLIAIEYDAYESMATEAIRAICEHVCSVHGAAAALALHSKGTVAVDEASVVVCVGARHRAAAFDACRQIMEELKRLAPIWKREVFEGGSRWQGAGPDNGTGE